MTEELKEQIAQDIDPKQEAIQDGENPPGEKPKEKDSGEEEEKELLATGQKEQEQNDIYGKPAEYDFSNVELMQGMTLESESTKEFSELAAKCNLSQKTADEFVKIGAKLIEKSVNNVLAQLQSEQIEQYKLATNTDPDIGGDKLNEALDIAELAYKEFATPKLKELIEQSGLKYNNEVIKTFRNIGLKMKEADIHNTGIPQGQTKTAAQILYGS